MNAMKKLYPEGWILYCPDCGDYVSQSDPQDTTRGKSVVIDDEPCPDCKETRAQEVIEAQSIMGRLGVPRERN